MPKVCVVAAGSSRFGELWKSSAEDLVRDAWADSGFSGGKPDELFVSSMASGSFIGQEHLGPFVLDALGLASIPALRVEAACASGGVAVRAAYNAIRSGACKIAAVIGLEKMTDRMPTETERILALSAHSGREVSGGATLPALYALVAARHMKEFGTTEEELAAVAVKNHLNGSKNPKAHFFGRAVSAKEVLSSGVVSSPLKVLDCAPVSDGAAVVVLADGESARKLCERPVGILACEQASDALPLSERANLTTFSSTVRASRKAFEAAGIPPGRIDFAEVHDCFTIAEILALEDIGFFRKGHASGEILGGKTGLGGHLPVNPSGGLKAKGHPAGATGVGQVAECFWQLSGSAANQVKGARYGLAHNVGGVGATATVTILGGEF